MPSARVVSAVTGAAPEAPLLAGTATPLHTDQFGRLLVSSMAGSGTSVWGRSGVLSLGVNGDVAAATGRLRVQRISIVVYVGAGYIYVCDKAGIAPTAASRVCIPVPFTIAVLNSPSLVNISFEDVGGISVSQGLVVGISTTGATYTAPVGASGEIVAFYS